MKEHRVASAVASFIWDAIIIGILVQSAWTHEVAWTIIWSAFVILRILEARYKVER
jgi:hypothetical protein